MFKTALILGGLGNLAIALSSLALPRLLGWRQELAGLRPLTRNLFWTYAGYTFGIHVWFGVVSIVAADDLLAGSTLARLVAGFIALYWGVRVIGQFAWYDRTVREERLLFKIGEAGYVTLFVLLTLIYGAVALR
jgi:hypothetical protein